MSGSPIFIGGAPRSGLTLLRVMLDAHPAISAGPDTGHLALTQTSADFERTLGNLHAEHFFLTPEAVRSNFARAIAAPMANRVALGCKRRWADKTAFNILVFEQLAKLFPDARFIHLVRDGRDLAASLLERQWRAPSGLLFDQCASVSGAMRYWASIVARGLALEAHASFHARVLRVRYEDVVSDPESALHQLCGFLGEAFDPSMLLGTEHAGDLAGLELETADRLRRPIGGAAVGRWRRDLAPEDAESAYKAHRSLFEALGYQPD